MATSSAYVPKTEGFRSDINGLRAWAVIAVVLYHFGVPGIGGGFAGVDVFFVISGYLMCAIILNGQEQRTFSIWRFYLARARRIWPALIVLCAVLLALGWFLLMPLEYKQLGKHARESLLFSSNLVYLDEAGYFDVAAQEKWLLHTWSLSVEWQFYLILPLVLILVNRLVPGRRAVAFILASLLLVSLGLCLWLSKVAASEAFYLFQSRAWEMLAGALVFMVGRVRGKALWQSRLLELIGFILILSTIVLFDKESLWPSWRALLPVIGTMLVLLAAREGSAWTAIPLAQWLGTRSYSIYLWHWPLVVALVYLDLSGDPLWVIAGISASLVLGHLSYLLVEVPSRRQLSAWPVMRGTVILLVSVTLVAVSAQQIRRNGFPNRLPEAVAKIEAEFLNGNPRMDECLNSAASCIYGQEPVRAVLLGDSHADAVVNALQASLPDTQAGVLFRGVSGCLITFGLHSSKECEELNRDLEREHSTFPADVPIVVVGRTSEYVKGGMLPADGKPKFHFGEPVEHFSESFLTQFRERYLLTMCSLAETHPLYLVRPTPEMPVNVPSQMGRSLLLGKREVSVRLVDYHKRHAFVWALQDEVAERCGARILDPLPLLCDEEVCFSQVDERPLYRDKDHFNEFGNRLLVPMFREIFEPKL